MKDIIIVNRTTASDYSVICSSIVCKPTNGWRWKRGSSKCPLSYFNGLWWTCHTSKQCRHSVPDKPGKVWQGELPQNGQSAVAIQTLPSIQCLSESWINASACVRNCVKTRNVLLIFKPHTHTFKNEDGLHGITLYFVLCCGTYYPCEPTMQPTSNSNSPDYQSV